MFTRESDEAWTRDEADATLAVLGDAIRYGTPLRPLWFRTTASLGRATTMAHAACTTCPRRT